MVEKCTCGKLKTARKCQAQPWTPANTTVLTIAASRDGKWVVVGTGNGRVIAWDAERRDIVAEFQGHGN